MEHGASFSIFVEGYLPQSLVCTLPQASQPPSSVFQHDPPLLDSQPDVLDMIDSALVEQLDVLKKNELNDATKRVSSLTSDGAGDSTMGGDDTVTSHSNAASESGQSGSSASFNFFPKKLQEGDMVRRGQSECIVNTD